MTEHRLVAKNIHRDGRIGKYWTCTCGEWHPNSTKNPPPWGGGRAPADVVMRHIKSEHAKHSADSTPTRMPCLRAAIDAARKQGGKHD